MSVNSLTWSPDIPAHSSKGIQLVMNSSGTKGGLGGGIGGTRPLVVAKIDCFSNSSKSEQKMVEGGGFNEVVKWKIIFAYNSL